jgi:hypothetical protein
MFRPEKVGVPKIAIEFDGAKIIRAREAFYTTNPDRKF